ncbi:MULTISPECIES: UDP-N-acetyl-D-mannosamine dehydrogenase [unclassified Caballeronia]|uniref:UDP-N-acetyl-D-mannosamine dehydrogenase n=1 Tax=unclassified Caballeronia TaxID=2646786 RepID=UPI002864E6F0|nr:MULTISPECIES: UDP-N-acetyl-D-mannosamine dehydrogenase [unclassified Caballeronia]MDR5754853.1 UDP-N-acetyl-D-mannosamine dehydrogenase [Caballeronia sp. LZ024]MDR5839646.1 UDP-N-acetyl-D-mannosamine dehydrogenase [Caballeronia sp. LZ031]
MQFEKISVVGLGYIGLPTATMFASRQIPVIGVDVNHDTVQTINRGEVHIVEPDLDMLVRAAVQQGLLRATETPEPADAFLVAVPTPFMENKRPDLSYIESAAKSIAPVLKKGDLVVLESTSPVGATEQMAQWLAEARPDLTFPHQAGEQSDIRIAHCPERVLPGSVMRELIENDRVIGGMTARCSEAARSLYGVFLRGRSIVTDSRTAEMCKLAENSFRDVNIAFANELSMICEELGINVWELIGLSNLHPRVNILQPGPGVGGHCIAVDPWFIVDSAPEQARLIRTAREVNDTKPNYVLDKVRRAARKLREPVVACFGLSFKANIDDLRESPAVGIARSMLNDGFGRLLVVEPHINELPACLEGGELVTAREALERADIVVLLVDHAQFTSIDTDRLQSKVVFDTRGLWSSRRVVP